MTQTQDVPQVSFSGSSIEFTHEETTGERRFSYASIIASPKPVERWKRSIASQFRLYSDLDAEAFPGSDPSISTVWTRSAGDPGGWIIIDFGMSSTWMVSALDQIESLRALPDNWDGYRSPAIGNAEIDRLRQVILSISDLGMPIPFVGPMAGGGVEVEWQCRGRDLGFEVEPSSDFVTYLQVDFDGGMEEGTCHPDNYLKLRELANWLLGVS